MNKTSRNVTMSVPTGRSEKRFARAVAVEICLEDEAMLNERASTENVSAHGVRVLIRRELQPGEQRLLSFPTVACGRRVELFTVSIWRSVSLLLA